MFKRILKSAAAMLAASIILAACGSNYANAQTIPLTYKGTNGTPFSIETAQKLTGLAGSVSVVDETGFVSTQSSATLYTDSSFQVYTQITSDPVFLAKWLPVSVATKTWVNPTALRNVICSGSKSVLQYKQSIATDNLADNCQFYNAYRARTN